MWKKKRNMGKKPVRDVEIGKIGQTTPMHVVLWGICIFLAAGIGYLFYDGLPGILLCLPLSYLFHRMILTFIRERKERQRLLEFKEMLGALATLLRAGYSLENAWHAAKEELLALYGKYRPIIEDMERVEAHMQLNVSITEAFEQFAYQSGIEEAKDFSEVLTITKRYGGNMIQSIEKTTDLITERIEVEEEIRTMLTGKRLEQRIMCGMPVAMMAYLRLTDPDFVEPLFHNPVGYVTVTVCLLGTVLAAYIGHKMVSITV